MTDFEAVYLWLLSLLVAIAFVRVVVDLVDAAWLGRRRFRR